MLGRASKVHDADRAEARSGYLMRYHAPLSQDSETDTQLARVKSRNDT